MAKVTAPLLSFGASGSIAKTLVASKWKGRPYMRQHVIPANPKTVNQLLTRNTWASGSDIWKIMGLLGRAPYDLFAKGQVLAGRNAMIGRYVKQNRGQADLTNWVMSPGAKGGTPPLSVVLSSPGVNDILATFVTPTPPEGWSVTSTIAMAIRDQDPGTGTLFATTENEDIGGLLPLLPGLTTGVLYVVGGWIKWQKADLTVAYSVATMGTFTPVP